MAAVPPVQAVRVAGAVGPAGVDEGRDREEQVGRLTPAGDRTGKSLNRRRRIMTTATTFDPRTAKERAAEIVDQDLCGFDDLSPLAELHTLCFSVLGSTAAEVAEKLAEFGCKGSRPLTVDDDGDIYGDMVDEDGNALAVYFRTVCGAASARFGADDGTIYWEGSGDDQVGDESVELPPVIREFQEGYQDFEYPDLYTI
jgi:hypothetical protein